MPSQHPCSSRQSDISLVTDCWPLLGVLLVPVEGCNGRRYHLPSSVSSFLYPCPPCSFLSSAVLSSSSHILSLPSPLFFLFPPHLSLSSELPQAPDPPLSITSHTGTASPASSTPHTNEQTHRTVATDFHPSLFTSPSDLSGQPAPAPADTLEHGCTTGVASAQVQASGLAQAHGNNSGGLLLEGGQAAGGAGEAGGGAHVGDVDWTACHTAMREFLPARGSGSHAPGDDCPPNEFR